MSTTEPDPQPADLPWSATVVRGYFLPAATVVDGHLLPAALNRELRVLLECVLCLRSDPDRCAGHVVVGCTDTEALQLMRNHLAQQHDILPTRQEPLKP